MIGWHGGAPGRLVGQLILPPTMTGLAETRAEQSVRAGLDRISQRPDRIYFASSIGLARVFAGGWVDGERTGYGSVYRVTTDEWEADQDLLSLPGVSFQAKEARVEVVEERNVAPNQPEFRLILEDLLAAHSQAKGYRS